MVSESPLVSRLIDLTAGAPRGRGKLENLEGSASDPELMLMTLEDHFFCGVGLAGLAGLMGFLEGLSESELMLMMLEEAEIFFFFLIRPAGAPGMFLTGFASTSESELMRMGEPGLVAVAFHFLPVL